MYLIISVLVVIGYIIWKFLEDEDNPLDKLPGPPRRPIVGCVFEFINITSNELFSKMRQFARLYGDRYLVKIINRRILHVSHVRDVELVLSHSKNIKKSKPYTFLEAWLGTGLLLSAGKKWQTRRKILTPAFHFNILNNFSVVMQERSRGLLEELMKLDGTEVSLMPLISDYTLFTICETAMGTQLDSDKSAASVQYKNAILQIGSLLLSRLTRVWLHNEYIFRKLPIGKRFEECLHTVHSFADNVIMERKKNWKPGEGEFREDSDIGSKRRLAMLDLLLEAENKGEINLEGIREEVNTFMFEIDDPLSIRIGGNTDQFQMFQYLGSTLHASGNIDYDVTARISAAWAKWCEGHDTTAVAIIFTLMLIADHPQVQEEIYEEIQAIVGDSDRILTMSDLANMKYLEAVIKETLRLYPSVPFIAREITEDFMLDDLPIKKGTEIAVHIYDLHRRPDLYHNPEEFIPERFLSGEVIHPYAFVPFSAGPRNCIGQRFAMLEMKYVLSAVCRNFKLYPRLQGARPALLADMLLRPAEPIYVKISKRSIK